VLGIGEAAAVAVEAAAVIERGVVPAVAIIIIIEGEVKEDVDDNAF